MKKSHLLVFLSFCTLLWLCVPLTVKSQLAAGKSKFFGNIIANSVPSNFSTYWNQVTPENAGKWGSVESSRDNMNWTALDNAYNYAKTQGFKFKQHCFVWGSQYPNWITSLSATDQKAEVEEWIQAFAQRYPNIDFIDVVNEPIKTACPFKDALGGNGTTGWDWVIWSFEKARQYCPNAKLLINEYGTENDPSAANQYLQIINLLKNRGLIDGIGLQGHYFNLDYTSASTLRSTLDKFAATGLPIYISELDIRGVSGNDNEATQLQKYQELFPVMWEHSGVAGITAWGYIEGQTWATNTGLLNSNGTERSAMKWLKQYFSASNIPVTGVTVSPTTASIGVGETTTLTATVSPSNATNKTVTWSSSNTSVATVSSTGVVTGAAVGSATITVTTQDGNKTAISTITVTNVNIPVTGVTVAPTNVSLSVGGTATLTASILPANASNKNITWASGNTAVATVNSSGLVTGVAVGSATITVTTTDGGYTATCNVTVSDAPTCNFGTPLAAALPTISGSYNKVYILGSGGPNLSNVTNFTINWSLPNNGLWQLSFNTNNGVPTWWLDLRTKATWKFNQPQPEITFTGTGIAGLDGAYWVAIDGSNFVMVSKTGGFTIYFSNSSTAPSCTKSAPLLSGESAEKCLIVSYPNPFSESFTLRITKPAEVVNIYLTDQAGRIINIVDKKQSNEIRLGENLQKGIYFLRIQTLTGNQTLKLIKK